MGSPPLVLRLNLIGQMEAWGYDRQNVLPLGRKTRALLAILALSAPRPVVRARLAELLWSRRHEEQARASLRQEIHRLLEALHPLGAEILLVTRDHVAFKPEQVRIDVDMVLNATSADPAGLDLLTGPILDEFDGVDPAFDVWLASERERVQDRARAVAESMLRAVAEPDAVIPAAQRLIGIDRAHEGAWRALMGAYAVRGERGMAVQAYERCRAALKEKLDAIPSPETQRLLAGIRAGNLAGSVRFDAPPEPLPEPGPAPAPEPAMVAPPKGETRIGVLPLQMLGTGLEEAHLSVSLADAMTAALAAFRQVSPVSSASLQQPGARDDAALRRTLGIEFLVDGSVQRAGSRLRVAVRLLDLLDGNRVAWACRFDRDVDDLLSLQDEVAAEVAGQVQSEIRRIQGRRAAARPLAGATADDLVLRAMPLMLRLRRDEFDQAGDLLLRATEIEPDLACAHAWRAFWLTLRTSQGWTGDLEAGSRDAGHHATRSVTLDSEDACNLAIAGHVRAYMHHQPREALILHERALALNPNLPLALGLSAATLTYLGDINGATRRFAQYQRIAPTGQFGFYFDSTLTLLELMRRDYAAAIRFGRRCSELNPNSIAGLRPYLAALGYAGPQADTRALLRRLLHAQPEFSIEFYASQCALDRPSDLAHLLAGLRLAGAPEGRAAVA